MATYSNIGIKLITTGDESGTWGTSTNTNFSDVLDEAIAGAVTYNISSDADFTLTVSDGTSSDARHAVIKFTSTTLSATRTCTFAPNDLQKTWVVINATTGGQSLTFKQGSAGATVTVPNGESAIIYSDGGGASAGAITRVLDSFTNTKITTGTLNATTLDLTNLEVTNIKAKDGTAAASIADSTGIVSLSANPVLSGGTANGVLYLNGSKVATSGSTVTFNGTQFSVLYSGASSATFGANQAIRIDSNLNTGFGVGVPSTGGIVGGYYVNGGANSYDGGFEYNGTTRALLLRSAGNTNATLTSAGDFGIGTTSPLQKLDVRGNLGRVAPSTGTQQAAWVASNTGGDFYVGIDNSTGTNFDTATAYAGVIWRGGAYPICFVNNSTERMRLDSSGNLGLGVTPSAWTTYKVFQNQRSAMASYSDGSPNAATYYTTNAFFDGSWKYIASIGASRYDQATVGGGNHAWFVAPSGTAGNAITFTQAMTLDASGRLGLGTASPEDILDIQTPSNNYTMRLRASASNFALVRFVNNANNNTDAIIGTPGANTLAFYTNGFNQRMAIDSSGNVGIGTASPGYKLEVSGGDVRTNTTNFLYANTLRLRGSDTYQIYESAASTNLAIATASGAVIISPNLTERMRIDSSGNVGIGTSSPSTWGKFAVVGSGNAGVANFIGNASLTGSNPTYTGSIRLIDNPTSSTAASGGIEFLTSAFGSGYGWKIASIDSSGVQLTFATRQNSASWTEVMRLDASGNVGIGGTAGADTKVNVLGTLPTSSNFSFGYRSGGTVPSGTTSLYAGFYSEGTTQATSFTLTNYQHFRAWQNGFGAGSTVTSQYGYYADSNLTGATNNYGFYSDIASGSNRWNFYANGTAQNYFAGNTLVGKTTTDRGTNGASLGGSNGIFSFVRDQLTPMEINRRTNDGNLLDFYQDGTVEGNISVSGNTVSYNAFAGSHWSQLQDDSKPDILRGTVMESINELCVWPGEQNERLPKSKVSDTAGSKKVYGVFMAWDNDWTATNDMLITSVGAFICRVNSSVTVQEGDLLESNGDGTARVQADDIIRSSTIGKVTSTVKTHQYADGSYCVPTVLYCG